MKVVYVAGPFRGPHAMDIHENVIAAERLSFEVAKLGAVPLCPHKNTENMHGALPDQFFLEGTLELLRRCDAVMLTSDWKRSAGARGEVLEAIERGIPCFISLIQLGAWLRGSAGSSYAAASPDFLRALIKEGASTMARELTAEAE